MLSTVSGMVTDVSPVQPEKAELPIAVTPEGIVTEVSPVQPEKAVLPIAVTPEGIVTEVSPSQSEKAELPIVVMPEGIVYLPVFPAGNCMSLAMSLLKSTPDFETKPSLLLSTVISRNSVQ